MRVKYTAMKKSSDMIKQKKYFKTKNRFSIFLVETFGFNVHIYIYIYFQST